MKPKKKLSQDTSFVIVGAGVAGLTAARQLADEGYRNITVIEAEATAGGKCRTVELAGKPFDMGAIVGTKRMYRVLVARSEQYGLSTTPIQVLRLSRGQDRIRSLPCVKSTPRLLWEGLKYLLLMLVPWRGLKNGEMSRLPTELCQNWAEVAARHRINDFEQQTRPVLTGMGYSFPESLPAVYAANMLNVSMILEHGETSFIWSAGTQKIWQCEAEELQKRGVRFLYNTRVQEISRTDGIQLTLASAATLIHCDELIVACDPRLLRLNLTTTEQQVLAAIRNIDYRVLACRIEGLPAVSQPTAFCLNENMCAQQSGHPMMLLRLYPEHDIYLSYAFGAGFDEQEIKALLAADVQALGGRVTEHLCYQEWPNYFPHFDSAALQAGILDTLQQFQGTRHTTYIGEWATFAMMPRVMQHAETVIRRLIEGTAAEAQVNRTRTFAGSRQNVTAPNNWQN